MGCRLCRGQGYSRGCSCSRLRAEFVPSHDKRTSTGDFTNFMDGLDGLVAGCMAVAIAALAIALAASWPLWALVGALLGFLLWNWSPAQVFMGDVGNTFLGAVFAGLVLQAPSWPEAFGLLLVATPLLGDACLCVPRRLFAGQRVFQAHRLHLFQRLYQAGWPHARVSSLYVGATALLALALLWGGLPWLIPLASFELLVGLWLDQRVWRFPLPSHPTADGPALVNPWSRRPWQLRGRCHCCQWRSCRGVLRRCLARRNPGEWNTCLGCPVSRLGLESVV